MLNSPIWAGNRDNRRATRRVNGAYHLDLPWYQILYNTDQKATLKATNAKNSQRALQHRRRSTQGAISEHRYNQKPRVSQGPWGQALQHRASLTSPLITATFSAPLKLLFPISYTSQALRAPFCYQGPISRADRALYLFSLFFIIFLCSSSTLCRLSDGIR